ncbi:MAG: hypothetical protein M3R24_00185 [Chloroflexota bacterium]|nr:hypothetical protein [Chloroflexota bacterium]
MEEYKKPELPKFEDEWKVVPNSEDPGEAEDEDTDVTYDTHTTVAFGCLRCGFTKYIHYWRNNPDGLDDARCEYAQLHGSDHEIVLTEYIFEE